MEKVTIISENGSQAKAYLEDKSEGARKKELLKERLYIAYILVAITAFSLTIYIQLRKKK